MEQVEEKDPKMKNFVFTLAYDGTSYFGWQKTVEGPSIEQTLQEPLEKIVQHPVTLQAASRTDRGVHAQGQVINFFTTYSQSPQQLAYNLNSLLPKTIVITHAEEKPADFHPTVDVVGKEYLYQLSTDDVQLPQERLYAWHTPQLDFSLMERATTPLIGKHDFAAFTNQNASSPADTIRTLYWIRFEQNAISIAADHFLYKMVRNIVGTLVDVGCGKLEVEQIPQILAERSRKQAGVCAPAHGLTLKKVFYDTASFSV